MHLYEIRHQMFYYSVQNTDNVLKLCVRVRVTYIYIQIYVCVLAHACVYVYASHIIHTL